MAITYTTYVGTPAARSNASGTLTLTTGDVICVAAIMELGGSPVASIANSGSALTWNSIVSINQGFSQCLVAAWWASVPDDTDRTVTVSWTDTNMTSQMYVIVHTGAHATTPVPAGKIYSGYDGTDVSQSITPTASGSALWMFAGDRLATNTFAAAANCTLFDVYHSASLLTTTGIRPTTQPRTDANAFTLGETDTSGRIAWVAFEVQAASSSTTIPRSLLYRHPPGPFGPRYS